MNFLKVLRSQAYAIKRERSIAGKGWERDSLLRGDPVSGRDERSKNEVGQGKDDIQIAEVALVVHMVMGVEPAEPGRLLDPTSLGDVHAKMEIFIEEVIKAEGCYPAKEDIRLEEMLDPKYDGGVQTDDQRRVPPGEGDFLPMLVAREKIGRARAKNAVMDQGVRTKRIRPEGLMHQKAMQNPFEKAGVEKKGNKACGFGEENLCCSFLSRKGTIRAFPFFFNPF